MLDLSKNYFELFGMPVDFRLDLAELSNRYRELQKVVHPDRYANATDQEKRMAMQGATLVNEAFATLKDSLRRAQYILELKGVDLHSQTRTASDQAFLMQQMELRETLAEATQAEDPQAVVDSLIDEISRLIKVQTAQLTLLLEDFTESNLDEALQSVYKMQFLNKLRDEAERLVAELEDAS